jgi:YteA family regulatory protein
VQQAQLKQLQQRLLAEREQQLQRIRSINEGGLGESMDTSFGELSTIDNHPADVGTELFERSKDFSLKEQARIVTQAIDHALEAMEQGNYGKCQVCGQKIAEERLEAVPYTTICFDCKAAEESTYQRQDRPVEEEVLKHPFGRTFNDATDMNVYDGADTWEDVARHSLSYETDPEYETTEDDLGEESQQTLGAVETVEDIPYEIDEEGVIYESFKPVSEYGSPPE